MPDWVRRGRLVLSGQVTQASIDSLRVCAFPPEWQAFSLLFLRERRAVGLSTLSTRSYDAVQGLIQLSHRERLVKDPLQRRLGGALGELALA